MLGGQDSQGHGCSEAGMLGGQDAQGSGMFTGSRMPRSRNTWGRSAMGHIHQHPNCSEQGRSSWEPGEDAAGQGPAPQWDQSPGLGDFGISRKPSVVREASLHIALCHPQQVNRWRGAARHRAVAGERTPSAPGHIRAEIDPEPLSSSSPLPPRHPLFTIMSEKRRLFYFFFFYNDLIAW